MEVKIKMGNYDVLQTGAVIAIEKEPIEFYILDLIITIDFRSSDEDKNMRIESNVTSGKTSTIIFWNFDNEIGCGVARPVVVGSLGNRELSLLVRFSSLPTGGKEIKYTWLTREITREDTVIQQEETSHE